MSKPQYYRLEDLSSEQVRSIVALRLEVWPNEKGLEELIDSFAQGRTGTREQEYFIVWEGDEPIAMSEIFPRTIGTDRGEMLVMALAGVCVSPKRRGEGLGRVVVEEAFRHVDSGRYPLSLFQTEVPDFYRKLGAENVTNVFRNGTSLETPDASPWWSEHIMIYPGDAPWPTGTIDLKGRGY